MSAFESLTPRTTATGNFPLCCFSLRYVCYRFFASVPHWFFCCVLPLIKTEAHHLIWQCASHDQTTEDPDKTERLNYFFKFLFQPADVWQFAVFAIWYMVTDVCLCVISPQGNIGLFLIRFVSPFLWEYGALWAIISSKIISRLEIAQSSVPNPLQGLLVMIYSARTKDISGTPEYIFWKAFWYYSFISELKTDSE